VTADLVEWLREQIAEDRRLAELATPGPWRPSDTRPDPSGDHWQDVYALSGSVTVAHEEPCCLAGDAQHIARWDPARVLAECDAKEQILAEHERIVLHKGSGADYYVTVMVCRVCGGSDAWFDSHSQAMRAALHPCPTLRLMCLPYADRPGYRPEWRPARAESAR
jgi:hypothetical protein